MNTMPSSSSYMFNQTGHQGAPPLVSPGPGQGPGSTSGSSQGQVVQKKKYPVNLIFLDPTLSNSDHVKVFKAILDYIRITGYNECFGRGKKEKLYQSIYDKAFKIDGILNDYERPVYTRLRNSIVKGLQLLNSVLKHAHSPGAASDGEAYPPHLAEVLTLLKTINESAPEPNPTISQQNRTVQNDIIGDRPPLGSNPNAPPRASTRTENERNGLTLAERSETGGALSESSESSDTQSVTSRSRKRPSNAKDAESMFSNITDTRKETVNLMNNINNNILSYQTSHHHTNNIIFQQKMLDAKVQLAREKLEFKKQALEREDRFRLENRQRENNAATTELLREAYNQAKEDLIEMAKIDDPDLYAGAKDLLKEAQDQYRTHLKNLSNRTQFQALPSFTGSHQAPPIFNNFTISSSAPNTPRPNSNSIHFQSVQPMSDITRATTVVNMVDNSSSNEYEHEHEHEHVYENEHVHENEHERRELNENHHLPV